MRPQASGGLSLPTAPPSRRHRRLVWAIALLCAPIVVLSFVKTDWPRNDFERFDDLRLTIAFFILLTAACLGYAKLCLDEVALSKATVVGGALAAGAMLWVSFPVGSKDLFLYALFGKVWGTYHANPYQVAPAHFATDPWLVYAPTLWAQRPAPYGPLFLWQTWLGDAIAGGHLWAAVWFHKTVATAALAAALCVMARLSSVPGGRAPEQTIALLAWNPLLLFESAGNGHNDAVMLFLLVAAADGHARGHKSRTVLVPALLVLATCYKWYAALVVPAFLVALSREGDRAQLRTWLLSAAGFGLVFGALPMMPLVDAVPMVLSRLIGHENLRTVLPMQLSPPLAVLLWVCNALGGGNRALLWFDLIRTGAFGLSVVAVLAYQWRGQLTLVQSVCLLTLALAMFPVTILWPWHLLVPVAFALLAGTQPWILLALSLTLLGLLSYFFTFFWAALVLILVTGVLVLMRRMHRLPSFATRV